MKFLEDSIVLGFVSYCYIHCLVNCGKYRGQMRNLQN